MRVLEGGVTDGLARCAADDGTVTEVEVGLIEPVVAGDRILVHAAVALLKLESAGEAAR